MNCPNCGSNLAEKGKFCPHCGTAISHDFYIKQEITDYARIAEANSAAEQSRQKTERSRQRTVRHHSFFKIIIIIICAFLLLILISQSNSIFSAIYVSSHNAAISRETDRMRQIQEDVLKEMQEGNYQQAMIKLNGLHFTADDYFAKEEWDKIRESLTEQIKVLMGSETNP